MPVSRDGDPVHLDNLATACWVCNSKKGDLTLAQLGWARRPPADPAWLGLTDLYEPMWVQAGKPLLGEEEMTWMRAVTAVLHVPDPTAHG